MFRPVILRFALATWLATACLAPPPPIVVETPFGDVRAESQRTAGEFADLLARLAPDVQALLPGSQRRPIDVWVQDELRVWRFHPRPESVRGFTLLSEEFSARRIHLQADGQSPWYLAHELVHALIGPTWAPLPGILEEGLGDVIAERLNPDFAGHIQAHRLLNASAFSGGITIEIAYRVPTDGSYRDGERITKQARVEVCERLPFELVDELLETTRAELHQRWPEIPEPFYGMAWLLVERIVERHGLEGLHELCLSAAREGRDSVPKDWFFEAAELDPQAFDAEFLSRSLERREFLRAIYLQPDAFGTAALEVLEPLRESLGPRSLFFSARPAFVLRDGSEIPLGLVGPIRERIQREWHARASEPARVR